jgi:hypothetical protein
VGLGQLAGEREQNSLHEVLEMGHHILSDHISDNGSEIVGRHFEIAFVIELYVYRKQDKKSYKMNKKSFNFYFHILNMKIILITFLIFFVFLLWFCYTPNNRNKEIVIPAYYSLEEISYTQDIAYNNSYENTLNKINIFKKNCKSLITFVIPSVNRSSLNRAILSLKNQVLNNWSAIIVFDGCEPNDNELLSDSRILYISINKLGKLNKLNGHSSAGFVRNIGMSLVTTPYTGFLDDDDILLPEYTQKLVEELTLNPDASLISFRMVNKNGIIPSHSTQDIIAGQIGISFCYKTELFRKGFKFRQSQIEDFEFANDINKAKMKIVLSPYITYLVEDTPLVSSDNLQRIIIN